MQKNNNNRFLKNGYNTIQSFKKKILILNDQWNHSRKKKISHQDLSIPYKSVNEKIYSSIFPFFRSHEILDHKLNESLNYGIEIINEINKDIAINPFSEHTEKQSKKMDKKHFLTVGLVCCILSSSSFNYSSDIKKLPHYFKLSFDFLHPKANPANSIVESLQPKFMTSVFKTKKEAFTKLLDITEGKANFFYRDNLGIATAYGWNPTKNSKDFNLSVANELGMSKKQINSIEQISNNRHIQSVPIHLKNMELSEKQIQKSADFMLDFYEAELLKVMKIKAKQNEKNYADVLKNYHALPNNQQVIMIHMAYKVGTPNFLKYNQFFKGLFKYMENPNEKNLSKITENFTYSHKTVKGLRVQDTRVENIHQEFFNQCSIKENLTNNKEYIQQQIHSCRNLVVSKTVTLNKKG